MKKLSFLTRTPALNAYWVDIENKIFQHHVQLILADSPTLAYNDSDMQVSGYFTQEPLPTLAIAMGKANSEWVPVLIHEACHMDQWIEQCDAWTNLTMPDGRDAVDWLDDWCQGLINLTEEQKQDIIYRAKAVELDCEKRVVEQIKKYGLDLDIPTYIQKANAYVQFYERVGQTKQWYTAGHAPYQIPEVWGAAPTFFIDNPTPDLQAAFEKHYPTLNTLKNKILKV